MAEIIGGFSTERPYYMEITWELPDFFNMLENEDDCLCSPPFSLAKSDWEIDVFLNGEDAESYIRIYLNRENFSVAQQRVKTTFSLKNCHGKNCARYSKNILCEDNDSFEEVYEIKRSKLEKEKRSLLPNGTLTVLCEITVECTSDSRGASEDELPETDNPLNSNKIGASSCKQLERGSPDTCKGTGDLQRTSPSDPKLQSDYKKLLDNEEDSDVCLKVSEKEFRAHKCILRARSSVFNAMFKHDTQEKNSGEVVIEDLDPESFPDFLQHVYSGSVDTLSEENVFNLYTAADKYDMADLKSQCKSYMERTLSVDTFCDVMITALRYKEEELLKFAVDFFSKNLTRIIVTVKWQKFLKEYDTAANELLIKALVPADQK